MVTQISHPEYRINNLPGFEGLVFTESSTLPLALPESVAFASARDSVLQSAREAWAFRIDKNGTLDSDGYQSTRTAALGVTLKGRHCIAIGDSPSPDENILLARAQEGYDAHRTRGCWLVPRTDPIIRRMLERSQDERRVFPALESTLILATRQCNGVSAYGAHPTTQAILGPDLTEAVATYLRARRFGDGYVWTLSPQNLRDLGVDDDRAEVRRVGVGGNVCLDGSYNLGANDHRDYYDYGRARGVRNNSSGIKGGC